MINESNGDANKSRENCRSYLPMIKNRSFKKSIASRKPCIRISLLGFPYEELESMIFLINTLRKCLIILNSANKFQRIFYQILQSMKKIEVRKNLLRFHLKKSSFTYSLKRKRQETKISMFKKTWNYFSK